MGLSSNFCQLSVSLLDLSSTFHAAVDITSTFLAPAQPSVNFHQLSVRLSDLPWTVLMAAWPSVKFLCGCGHSVNFLCVSTTFRQYPPFLPCIHWPSVSLHLLSVLRNFPSIFRASTGPSVNFCQLSLSLWDILSTSVKFPLFREIFHQQFLHSRDILSTSVNFLSKCRIFRKQYARPQSLPSASVYFPCIWGNYRTLASTFHEAGWPSVSIPCIRRTCLLRSTSLSYSVVQAVQQRFLPRTHEIFSYYSCYFHYSVVPEVRLCWTSWTKK